MGMPRVDEMFEVVAGHADAIVLTDGRGRAVERAGPRSAVQDVAARIDLLVAATGQMGEPWELGEGTIVMISFSRRMFIVAALPGGGNLAVLAKHEVQPGILLSYVRRAVAVAEEAA